MRKIILFLSFLGCVYGCGNEWQGAPEYEAFPEIFPDYREVTVPVNIAPLNFMIAGAEKTVVEFRADERVVLTVSGKGKIDIPLRKWHTLLEENKGKTLQVKVYTAADGVWKAYRAFPIHIAADSIDPYLAYRLIEPGYELGKRLGLYQRELSTFKEKAFVSPWLTPESCVNCHAFCNYSPDQMMYHVRWKNSGTVIAEPGKLRKVNTKTASVISPGAYRMWHPSGKYIAFSNNQTHQAFHAFSEKKIEVYDLASGLMIYDVAANKVITDPRFTASDSWKTFPAWSPDGKYLYFCEARPKSMPMEYKELKYQLYRVGFNSENGSLADSIESISAGKDSLKSIAFPLVSPDGKYLLYTVAGSGTFPIWHKDADLGMIELESGLPVDLSQINSESTESYHAWASRGRWIVFSSRRLDNLYTHLFLAYFDQEGRVHKPFLLPQKDPEFYKYFLKSYNVPEFIKGPVTISPDRFCEVMEEEAQNAV